MIKRYCIIDFKSAYELESCLFKTNLIVKKYKSKQSSLGIKRQIYITSVEYFYLFKMMPFEYYMYTSAFQKNTYITSDCQWIRFKQTKKKARATHFFFFFSIIAVPFSQ